MKHIKIMVAEKEVFVFFDACDQHIVPAAIQTIQNHLSDAQVKKVFDDLGLVNITSREAILFSLEGEMISLPLTGESLSLTSLSPFSRNFPRALYNLLYCFIRWRASYEFFQ